MTSVALVCDWLTVPGGAEKVLLELHRMYPDAPIYTSQYRPEGIPWFKDATVITGWLDYFPAGLRKFLGPLRQLYFSHLDLSDYDLVISVTGAEAKAVKARRHICYCHAPTQYYWGFYDRYLADPGFGFLNPLVRLALKLFIKPLRSADRASAQNPTKFVTASTYTAVQIKQFYGRPAEVIHPPVAIKQFTPSSHHPEVLPRGASKTPKERPEANNLQSSVSSVASFSSLRTFDAPSGLHSGSPRTLNPSLESSSSRAQVLGITPGRHPKTEALDIALGQSSGWAKASDTGAGNTTKVFEKLEGRTGDTVEVLKNLKDGTRDEVKVLEGLKDTIDISDACNIVASGCPSGSLNVSREDASGYFIIACRHVTWKRVDLAVSAARELGVPLLVVGDGPENASLRKLAASSPNIHFLPWQNAAELAKLLHSARAFLFPSCEPFGIAAVEALAAGCPVIAYRSGGSRDFIVPGKNGLYFSEQTPSSLVAAIKKFDHLKFDRRVVSATAANFSAEQFGKRFRRTVAEVMATPSRPSSHKSRRKYAKKI